MKNVCLLFLILSIFIICCNSSQALSDKEKMTTFYKYDSMFFYGEKDKYLDVEIGNDSLITDINDISKNYNNQVNIIIEKMNLFCDKNFDILGEYKTHFDSFKQRNNKTYNKEKFLVVHEKLKEKMRTELLPQFENVVRCMFAIENVQYIEVAKLLINNTIATTLLDEEGDTVYWNKILYGEYPYQDLHDKYTNKIGLIKYDYWFYESNLKIRIVKQIRDKQGNYLGEIYVDYYKLDKYDELFDKKGNPKVK